MILFCVSPLLVYPLWRARLGAWQRAGAVAWWGLVLLASVLATAWYTWPLDHAPYTEDNMAYYDQDLVAKYSLPVWNFAPWGYRNQCYIIGLMTGYL